jgi:hypothetical protein
MTPSMKFYSVALVCMLALALILQIRAAHSEERTRVAELLCDSVRVNVYHYGNPRVLVYEIIDPVERARFARNFETIEGWPYLNGKRCVDYSGKLRP